MLLCSTFHQPVFAILPAHPVYASNAGLSQSADHRNAEVSTDSGDIKYGEDNHGTDHYSAQPPDVLRFQPLELYTFVNPLVDGKGVAGHIPPTLRNSKKCFKHRSDDHQEDAAPEPGGSYL